jgi:hypothetical protein
MSSPLHHFLQDLIREKTAHCGADKLDVSMTVDNPRIRVKRTKRSRPKSHERSKAPLDVSDHTKGMSRWEPNLCDTGKQTQKIATKPEMDIARNLYCRRVIGRVIRRSRRIIQRSRLKSRRRRFRLGRRGTHSHEEQERTKFKRLELESKVDNEGHQKVMCQRFSNTVPEVLTYIREERGASATGGIHKETVTTLSNTIVRYITRG